MSFSRFSVSDLIIFSRMAGAALLVGGCLLAGLYCARWCQAQGYPSWTGLLCLAGGLAWALFSGFCEIRSILAQIRRNRQ